MATFPTTPVRRARTEPLPVTNSVQEASTATPMRRVQRPGSSFGGVVVEEKQSENDSENSPRASSLPLSPHVVADKAEESEDDSEEKPRAPSPQRKIVKHRAPEVAWHPENTFKAGRVLLIDYVSKDDTPNGRRKTVAQEFHDLSKLRAFYKAELHKPALRAIHVQNASWATRFFLRKYNIEFNLDPSNDSLGTNFGRSVRDGRPRRRGGKPVLTGHYSPPEEDQWRGISRSSFTVDWVHTKDHIPGAASSGEPRVAQLNGYDELDDPTAMFDIVASRLSVYMQYTSGDGRDPMLDEESDLNPYQRAKKRGETVPETSSLDNHSTIIVFDSGTSTPGDTLNGTLVGARAEIEKRWRHLTFFHLPRDVTDIDSEMGKECMLFILQDIFKALESRWDQALRLCSDHVNILEEEIYESPAEPDENRATALSHAASRWLMLQKLMRVHSDVVSDLNKHLVDLLDDIEAEERFTSTQLNFDRLNNTIQEDIINPTAAVSELMFRSVGYRDSRISLKLNTSLWRLSWITFIFLPLTFVVGFFGMNVDTFENNPSIKWYFVAVVGLGVLVLGFWYFVKHSPSREHQMQQRRAFETFNRNLAETHPQVWTRQGPRRDRVPASLTERMKWRLLTSWYAPQKLRSPMSSWSERGSVGTWSRLKYKLTTRWLAEPWMQRVHKSHQFEPLLEDVELGLLRDERSTGAVGDLLAMATVAAVVALPSIRIPRPISKTAEP